MSFFDDSSLAFLPSGAAGKDGKAYSIKPTDGTGDFTFSRGSNLAATRVGPTGLIEKGRENLLTYSNDFSQWTKINTTTTSGQSGYDGSSDATEVSFTAGSSRAIGKGGLVTSIVNFSIYVKAGTHDIIQFTPSNSATTFANFDISASNPATGNTGGLVVDSSIEDIGGGWYRCSAVLNNSGSGTMWIWIVDSLTSGRAASVSTDGTFFVQDAQLEIGLAASEPIESGASTGKAGLLEDEPRFDYSGGATCPSLLLEPSRTNVVPYTEYFEGLGGDAGLDFNYNDATSPEGLTNAVQVVSNNTAQSYFGYFNGTAPAGDNTFSVFAKYDNCQYICIRILGFTTGDDGYYWFDIQNGTKGSKSGSTITYDIEDYGNGWYRCYVIHNVDSGDVSGAGRVYLCDSDNNLNSALNKAAHLYGNQWEEGSYPTSYIPNHSGGTITRGDDDLTSTLLSIDGLFGPTSGSIFMEFTNPLQGLNNNWFSMTGVAAGAAAYMRVRGYWQMNIPQLTWNPSPNLGNTDGATKIAVKWGGGIAKIFIDGAEDDAATYTGGDINMNVSLTGINGGFNFAENDANFKQILFFPEALSDSDCITLTT